MSDGEDKLLQEVRSFNAGMGGIEARQREFLSELKGVAKDTRETLIAVKGDNTEGNLGLEKKVLLHGTRISTLEQRVDRIENRLLSAIGVLAITVIGWIGTVVAAVAFRKNME